MEGVTFFDLMITTCDQVITIPWDIIFITHSVLKYEIVFPNLIRLRMLVKLGIDT